MQGLVFDDRYPDRPVSLTRWLYPELPGTPRYEHAALLALVTQEAGRQRPGRVAADVAREGSALAVWENADPPGDDTLLSRAAARLEDWQGRGLQLVSVLDRDYPARLRSAPEPPPFLFHAGRFPAGDGMSVVGARGASAWALEIAGAIARILARAGLAVIGGLAAGIEATARRAALDEGGRTVQVLASGTDAAGFDGEPAGERELVLSPFLPDVAPTRDSVLRQRETITQLAVGTIVVEATERSEARVQAELAGAQGRPLILTSVVAESTTWGAALRGQPGVRVVDDLHELVAAVHAISGGRAA